MAKNYEIKLPKLGESIVSANIVHIYKKEKEFIQKDETLMEVSTDKVNSEIPSPVSGTIKEILVKVDDNVLVGDTIAVIITEDETEEVKEEKIVQKEQEAEKDKKNFFSPAVMRFAKENGLEPGDLENIQGSGENNRITKKDVEDYLSQKKQDSSLKLSNIRQAIANNMIKSLEVPHAYLMDEIDVTDLVHLINEKKQKIFDKYKEKLTITSFLAMAIAKAAKKYPLVNSSFKKGEIILKKDINLGIAVNVHKDVIVPVIKNIQDLSFIDIIKHLNKIVQKAKNDRLEKSDIENGTITLTNFGMTKISMGLPIIKYPEACIIGVGSIKKKVCVIDNQMKIRSILMLSMSFDHRIFDGIYACNFITEIKKYLEDEFERSF